MVLNAGVAFFGPPNTYTIMGAVPKEKYGMAAGTIATLRRFGNQLSVAIPMMVFSVFLGNTILADVPALDFLKGTLGDLRHLPRAVGNHDCLLGSPGKSEMKGTLPGTIAGNCRGPEGAAHLTADPTIAFLLMFSSSRWIDRSDGIGTRFKA